LHRFFGANMGDNALGGAQFDARLSIRANGILIDFELGIIRRAENI
jgi:hypothetical protein